MRRREVVGPLAVVVVFAVGGGAWSSDLPATATPRVSHPQSASDLSVATAGRTSTTGRELTAAVGPIRREDPDRWVRGPSPTVVGVAEEDDVSFNWAGQIDTGTVYTEVEGAWTVPTIQPSTSPKYASTWIGIDGATNSDLIQTGTTGSTANGETSYYAWVAICPTCAAVPVTEPVNPGDEMAADIFKNATGSWEVEIEDETRHWQVDRTYAYDGPATSAEWITERPGLGTTIISTLADFGSARFHDVKFTGTDPAAGSLWPSYMVGTTHRIIAYPSEVTPTTTGTFTNHYGTPRPTVTSVSPTQGSTNGGTTVTVEGTYLLTGLVKSVHFGTASAPFSVSSDGVVTATAPAATAGPVDVRVTTNDGTSAASSADRFTYIAGPPSVTSISPRTGPTTGGTKVSITGSSFIRTVAVDFGSTAADFSVTSSTRITATSPTGTGGEPVTVRTSYGTSAASDADVFTYVVPPPGPPAAATSGYDLVGSDGGVFVFSPPGTAGGFFGSLPGLGLHVDNVVGIDPTLTDQGYFVVGADGGVFAFGSAPYLGSLPADHVTPAAPIAGLVAADTDRGYFLVGRDGGVFAFGTVPFLGSLPEQGVRVDDIIGIASTPAGTGYWLIAANGTIYAFGSAQHLGTAVGTPSPVSAIAGTPTGGGYWITTQSGAVYAYGNAKSFGTLPGDHVVPDLPVIGIVHTADVAGYWLIGADGGIFAFGDAGFVGSLPGLGVHVTDVVGAVPTQS